MSRTKIRQVIQIANSETYDDAYASAHVAGGAEPTHPDVNIEHDLNVLRTNMKDLKGTADWFTEIPAGEDMAEMAADIDNLEAALGSSTGLAGMDYTTDYIVTDSTPAREAIGDLDGYLNTLASAVANFTGMDGYNDSSPDYTSAVGGPYTLTFVQDGYDLEQAIAVLDVSLANIDPLVTLQDAFDNSQTAGQTSPEIDLGASVDLNVGGTGTSKLHVEAAGGLLVDNLLDVDGSVDFDGTTADFLASGAISLDAGAASNFSTTTGGMTIAATAGGVLIDSDGAGDKILLDSEGTAADAIEFDSAGGISGGAAGNVDFSATVDVFLQAGNQVAIGASAASEFKTTSGDLTLEGGPSDGYLTFDQQFTSHAIHLSTADTSWESAIETEDGRTGINIGIVDAINAAARIADSGNTLQEVYNNSAGADPDITITDGDELDFELGGDTASFSVSNDTGDQVLRVTDGYVQVDGYFSVIGDTFVVDSTINDADHWMLSPDQGAQTALTIRPKTTKALYTANLFEIYDGYSTAAGGTDANATLRFRMDEDGDAYFADSVSIGSVLATSGDLVDGSDGDLIAQRLEVDGASRFDGNMDLNANFDHDGTTFDSSVTTFGVTASGAITMSGAADSTIAVAGPSSELTLRSDDGYLVFDDQFTDAGSFAALSGVALSTAATAWDATIVAQDGRTNENIGILDAINANAGLIAATTLQQAYKNDPDGGDATITTDATDGAVVIAGTEKLQVTATGGLDLDSDFDQDGATATFDLSGAFSVDAGAASNVTTTTGDLTLAAAAELNLDGATVDINSAGALTVDSTSALHTATSTFDINASGPMSMDSGALASFSGAGIDITSDAGTLDLLNTTAASVGSTDGYISFDDGWLPDAYYLSTGATGWSTAIESIDGRTGNNIGIVDAINAAAAAGGGIAEKAIFIIASSDARLFSTGALTGNGLDLDGGSGPDRGSIDLSSVGTGHLSERDLEVFVNGVLQLSDSTQGTATGSATDDYYLASDDDTRIVFAFALAEGDVVTVVNRTPEAGEDVDAGWNY